MSSLFKALNFPVVLSIIDNSGLDSILCFIATLAHVGIKSIRASNEVFYLVVVPPFIRIPGKYFENILNNSGLPLKF